MPLLMSLEGPRLGAIDEIRAKFYANLPQSMFRGKAYVGPVQAQLKGLGVVFPPMPSFTASLSDNKLLVIFAIGMGMWFAASARGQKLVGKYFKRKR